MTDHTERLIKIATRESFLTAWEHAQFILKHTGCLDDTSMIEQYRAELAALKAPAEEGVA